MKYLKILSFVMMTGLVFASCGNDGDAADAKEETTETKVATPPPPPPPPTPPKTEVEVNMETPAGDVKVKTER